jgi:hypothetical protein
MRTKPSLSRIVTTVKQLYLPKRNRAVQGCQPHYSDDLIVALAVYQHLAGFKYANAMLDSLAKQGLDIPAESTYSERKKLLLGSVILAVKALCGFGEHPRRVHMDSKQVATSEYARAARVKLPGSVGWDAINECYFYGLRLHSTVDDEGWLRRVVLRKAHEHDVTVAPRLLTGLSYTVVTGDKGYVSQPLRERFAPFAVDVIAKRRRNQNPAPARERFLLQQHKQVETTFSSLDTRGLLVRRYRKPWGLVFHLFSVLLADFFHRLFQQFPALGLLIPFSFLLSRIGV